jgi:hypothetical protein
MVLIYQITNLPNYQIPVCPFTKSLDLTCRSHIVFFHLVMGSAVRIRHCPATVSAENLSSMPLGKVPGRSFRLIEA